MTRIQTILACHNRPEKTVRCIRRLQEEQTLDLRIRVVDSSSEPETAARIQADFPEVELIQVDPKKHWGDCMKIGLEVPTLPAPDYWLWLNDDVDLNPGALQALIQTSRNAEEAIAIGSLRCPQTGTTSYGGQRRPSEHPSRVERIQPTENPQAADTFEGNLVLIPHHAKERIGSFGQFRHNFGDIDYGLRARKLGIPILVAPGWLGTCPPNPEQNSWHKEPSMLTRLTKAASIKHLPPSDWWRFLATHGPSGGKGLIKKTLWFLAPYVKAACGATPSHQDQAETLLLWNYVPVHFAGWMRMLNRKLPKSKFLLSTQMDETRLWKPDLDGIRFEVQRCLSKMTYQRHPWGFRFPTSLHIPYSTIPDIMRHRPKTVVSTEAGARSLQALLLAKLTGSYKIAIQLRESETTEMFRGPLRRLLRRIALPQADIVIVNGQSGKRVVAHYGVPESKIRILHSGTDLETFLHIPPATQAENLRLLYVGELNARKGIVRFTNLLADVLEQHPEFPHITLTLIGAGDWKLTRPLPPNLELHHQGWHEYKTLPEVYTKHDVFVMPSLADEWGMVVNEAMACRLPVLGCTGSQAVEELVTTETGWTYPPQCELAAKEAIMKMLKTPSDQRRTMGEKARDAALDCSDKKFVDGLATIIQELNP